MQSRIFICFGATKDSDGKLLLQLLYLQTTYRERMQHKPYPNGEKAMKQTHLSPFNHNS
jgi:hypothetical protein